MSYITFLQIVSSSRHISYLTTINFSNNLGFNLYATLLFVAWLQFQIIRMKFKIMNTNRDLNVLLMSKFSAKNSYIMGHLNTNNFYFYFLLFF